MTGDEARFCLRCGSPLALEPRFGRERPVCVQCGWIYFTDPKVAVVAAVLQDRQVLLVRRVNVPRQGFWSLPGGFLDAGEDPAEAVKRECMEETGLVIQVNRLLTVVNGRAHPRGADLLLAYQAEAIGGSLQAGDDADQAAFFPLDALPELAFESTAQILGSLSGPAHN